MKNTGHVGFCLGNVFRQHMIKDKISLKFFVPEISKVKGLDKQKIREAFQGITITDLNGEKINNEYISFLDKRRGLLEKIIKRWIKAGYPRDYRYQEKKSN